MKRNPLGGIFAVEKKLGRGDLFEIICSFADGSVSVERFSHEDHDGLGALVLASQRWTGARIDLPCFNLKTPMTPQAILDGWRGLSEDMRSVQTRWKSLNVSAKYSPENLAWRVFSPTTTNELIAISKNQNISMNTLLLGWVNTSVAELLLDAEQNECCWLIPVNMRRNSLDTSVTTNQTASVGLQFSRTDSQQSIEKKYRRALNRWRALASLQLIKLTSLLPERILLDLAKRRGERNFWIGSFSNLGVWNFPGVTATDRWPIALSIAPPAGTPCFPVGIGIITWQGHLSISVRIHPGLVSNNEQPQETILAQLEAKMSAALGHRLEIIRSSQSHGLSTGDTRHE